MACRPAPASTDSAGPTNCATPATTETKPRKADRMDVTLRFSYEAPDKIQQVTPYGCHTPIFLRSPGQNPAGVGGACFSLPAPACRRILLRRFQLVFLVNQRNLVLLWIATTGDFDLDLLGGFIHRILNVIHQPPVIPEVGPVRKGSDLVIGGRVDEVNRQVNVIVAVVDLNVGELDVEVVAGRIHIVFVLCPYYRFASKLELAKPEQFAVDLLYLACPNFLARIAMGRIVALVHVDPADEDLALAAHVGGRFLVGEKLRTAPAHGQGWLHAHAHQQEHHKKLSSHQTRNLPFELKCQYTPRHPSKSEPLVLLPLHGTGNTTFNPEKVGRGTVRPFAIEPLDDPHI